MLNRWRTTLRLWTRLATFVCGTILFWGCMEVDFLLHRRTPRIDLINKWVPRWASTLLRAFGVRIVAYGPHADQGEIFPGRDAAGVGRIFVANHRSGVDIPAALTVVAAHAISRHDLATWPLIGGGARRIGTLFVDRQSRRSGATVLLQISNALAAGEGILMFPEGTAFVGDEVRPFKPGAFKAAQRAGAEIIPMGIAYGDPAAYYVTEPFLTHMKRIASLPRLDVAVEIGEPLRSADASSAELNEIARSQVEELVCRARQRLIANPT